MKLNRFTNLLIFVFVLACRNHASEVGVAPTETPPYHTRSLLFFSILPVPKPFTILSKPPPPKDDEQPKPSGGGLFGNVLQGGSIAIEIRPLAPFQGIIDHAKKILPGGGHGTVGRPSHEKPDHHEPGNGGHHEEEEKPHHPQPGHERPHNQRPGYERPHHQQRPGYPRPQEQRPGYERPHEPEQGHDRPHQEQPGYERPHQQRPGYQRPHQQRPGYERPPGFERPGHEKPLPDNEKPEDPTKDESHEPLTDDVPAWEDIGEDGDSDDGEGVLMPRKKEKRPKRFVDSKIYHVPLKYVSNGRTHRVRRIRNGLAGKDA